MLTKTFPTMVKRVKLSNEFTLRKCQNGVCTAEDRISQLPDDILVYILSFLTVKEAADTSVLSRRWLSLWRFIFRLDFDARKPSTRRPKILKRQYVRWVNHTLRMCKGQNLDQFRVCFDLTKFARHDIDKWLQFAFSRKVQRLELDFLSGPQFVRAYESCYTFPKRLLGTGDFSGSCNFKSVRLLLLKSVNVTGEVLEFFLHNCPFLEQMVVVGSGTLVNLEVSGPSLKLRHLEITYCHCIESLRICDTNLVTLKTSAGEMLLLKNVPMLVEVYFMCVEYNDILVDISSSLSCALSQLEVLTIDATSAVFYSRQASLEHYDFPELPKLKKFTLTMLGWGSDDSLLGFTSIIRAAPYLKEFELQFSSLLFWSDRECVQGVKWPLRHLKVVKLWGMYSGALHLELVRYFVENALALDKIIIDPMSPIYTQALLTLDSKGIKDTQTARNNAKLQLEGEVPPHVELVIL